MRRFRFLLSLIAATAALFLFSCEKAEPGTSDQENTETPENPENPQEPENPENPENPEKPETPEKPEPAFPETANTYVINGNEYTFKSSALMQIGEDIAIAGTPDMGYGEVTDIMTETSEFFFAAISPILMNQTFDPMTETSKYTFISTLAGAQLETVAPELTDEIKEGLCLTTYEQGVLSVKICMTLADDTAIGIYLSAEEGEDIPIEINENEIGYGNDLKPLRAAFYLEEGMSTYLFFTAANISYFSELSIAKAYMYLVVPTRLINGKEVALSSITSGQSFMFGVQDNVAADNCLEIDSSNLQDAEGFFCIENPELGVYTVSFEFIVNGTPYYVSFDGECISAELEPPVEVVENYFIYNKQEAGYLSAELEKAESIWNLHLNLDNNQSATLTMSSKFFQDGGTFGFSQDPNMAVTYDGKTFSKANGYSGTISVSLDETANMIEVEFTNYKDCEFYYKGEYTNR